MSSAALSLRAAVRGRLAGDAALSALTGGPRIYDEPPRGSLPPYVALGRCESQDASGDGAPAEEHALTLEVWSREGGLSEALRIADRVVRLLDDADLSLDGARLAGLAWRATEADRVAEAGLRRATLTFRAVTELA
ncbi:DUF3168 domain-containing protein [Chenggangzhangella methanolivorans]|uniref:DUF3168 domain-containing protein n=2 Tax=Chenggangzhangella methanolivorans TaxID=1437009 RepID=A0A9E6RAT9_9HYPH|nr:DUF3168 domain-containing protein [Chenggangzhangella methanolivorans]